MGICPSADGGGIRCPSADGQSECGSKKCRNARQPANEQSVC